MRPRAPSKRPGRGKVGLGNLWRAQPAACPSALSAVQPLDRCSAAASALADLPASPPLPCSPRPRRSARRVPLALLDHHKKPEPTPPEPVDRVSAGAEARAKGTDSAAASAGGAVDGATRTTTAGALSQVGGGGWTRRGAKGAWWVGRGGLGSLLPHAAAAPGSTSAASCPTPPPRQASGTKAETGVDVFGDSLTSSGRVSSSGKTAGTDGASILSTGQVITTPNAASAVGEAGRRGREGEVEAAPWAARETRRQVPAPPAARSLAPASPTPHPLASKREPPDRTRPPPAAPPRRLHLWRV